MKKYLVVGVTLLLVVLSAAGGLVMVLFGVLGGASKNMQAAAAAGGACSSSWQGDDAGAGKFNQQQLDAAATIYAAAKEAGVGDAGATIGIATAIQESQLGADPRTLKPNGDGDIGLFQQRVFPGWYGSHDTQQANIEQLLDHAYQARNFYHGVDTTKGTHIPGLLDIKGWQSMRLTEAAQAVQVSAYPEAYAKHESVARTLVQKLAGGASGPVVCADGAVGGSLDCPPSGLASEAGLQPDALRALRCIKQKWPSVKEIHGKRNDPGSDHHNGNALDPMIPDYGSATGIALGDAIAEWAKQNAQGLGVKYIIWREKLWSVERASQGWRTCGAGASCYAGPDDTEAHRDHVHISFFGAAGTGASADAGPMVVAAVDGLTPPIKKGQYRKGTWYGKPGKLWKSGYHTGLDFVAPTGTQAIAVIDGTISYVGWGGAYGNLVKLRSADGTEFYYAHLVRAAVSQGQKVRAGTLVGHVGATGNVTGPHLHFEVRVAGSHTDPDKWMAQRGVKL